jgi:hypothetical protein
MPFSIPPQLDLSAGCSVINYTNTSEKQANTPLSPKTSVRRNAIRTLAIQTPNLPSVIDTIVATNLHLTATTDKKSILQLLLAVMEAIVEPDPLVAEKIQREAFREICDRLRIEECLVDVVLKELNKCCARKWCSCFFG